MEPDPGESPEAHRHYEEMAVAHVLGGLDEAEGRLFRSHLLECGDCRARVGELRALAHELADVERDERRVRATSAVETKAQSESDEEDEEDSGDRRRRATPFTRGRILAVLGIVVLLALAGWNFTLRGTVDRLEHSLERSSAAASVLEFGAAGQVQRTARDVRGQVRVDGDELVVIVDGLRDGRSYGLYLLDDAQEPVFRAAVRATDSRLYSMISVPAAATTLLLTAPESHPGGQPSGQTMFEADLPEGDEESEEPTSTATTSSGGD